jgi:LPPG:FO 2-phospho-L-lactate transferase
VLPVSDAPVRTVVETDSGTLAFQEYFVREQCRPAARRIRFEGVDTARPTSQVHAALADRDLAGVIICPSNPYLSIDPMLAVSGLREALRAAQAPVIAVTPLIGGKAVKGPTAKIMRELGIAADVRSVVQHYDGLIDGFVLDTEDAAAAKNLPLPTLTTNTLMRTLDDKIALAEQCVAFCVRLGQAAYNKAEGARA